MPTSIAFDSQHRMYVANNGMFVNGMQYVTVYAANWASGDTAYIEEAPFAYTPQAIAFDVQDQLYATQYDNSVGSSLMMLDANWVGSGNGPSVLKTLTGSSTLLDQPSGVAFDSTGNVYVSNTYTNTVTVYAANPAPSPTPTPTPSSSTSTSPAPSPSSSTSSAPSSSGPSNGSNTGGSTTTPTVTTHEATSTIHFNAGKAKLDSGDTKKIKKALTIARTGTIAKVKITGYAAPSKKGAYKTLAGKRAAAVKSYLKKQKVKVSITTAKAKGSKKQKGSAKIVISYTTTS